MITKEVAHTLYRVKDNLLAWNIYLQQILKHLIKYVYVSCVLDSGELLETIGITFRKSLWIVNWITNKELTNYNLAIWTYMYI